MGPGEKFSKSSLHLWGKNGLGSVIEVILFCDLELMVGNIACI